MKIYVQTSMFLLAFLLTHTLSLSHRANRREIYFVSGCLTFIITAAILLFGLLAVFGLLGQVNFPSRTLNTYNSTPGDTHIISYSSTYCNELTVSDTEPDSSLYLLKSKPPLSGPVNNFTARPPSTVKADTYQYLKFHLYAGSKLVMKYCLNGTSTPVTFSLVKGSGTWGRWKDDKSSHYKISFPINNTCSEGNKTLLYNFTSTDYYYYAFDNLSPLTDSRIEVTLLLQRTEYVAAENNTIEKCYECGVPYRSHYVALLSVDNDPYSFNSNSNIHVGVFCQPRVWVYVLIVLIPLLFLEVTVYSLCVLCDCTRRRRARYMALNRGQPSVNARGPSGPAPVNPCYGAMPSSYGPAQFANFAQPSSKNIGYKYFDNFS